MPKSRTSKPEALADHLSTKHQKIDRRVAELDGRLHLTGEEEQELQQLKKQKLRLKDELSQLRA